MSTLAAKIAGAVITGKLDDDLDDLLETITKRRARIRARDGIRVRLVKGLRPAYLSGCPGTVGIKRGERWEFFPDPGTRAAQRGEWWLVRFETFDQESQQRIMEAQG